MSHIPQSSFALVDALIDTLTAKGILNNASVDTIMQTAVARAMSATPFVEHSAKGPHARAADFIRDAMLRKQDLS